MKNAILKQLLTDLCSQYIFCPFSKRSLDCDKDNVVEIKGHYFPCRSEAIDDVKEKYQLNDVDVKVII